MINRFYLASLMLALTLLWLPGASSAQTFPTDDAVVQAMWEAGMEDSHTRAFAHELMDVIGPRLSGSEGLEMAQDWLIAKYEAWGISAEKQQYGTWEG